MNNHNKQKRIKRNDSGVALIISLLLLMLFTVMTLSMVIATTSDTLIDGYYRNARGSFYAADSGINAVRQYMINQLKSGIPSPFVPYSSSPMNTAQDGTIMTNIGGTTTGFTSYQSILGSNSSWKGSFQVNYNAACATTGVLPCPTFLTLPAICTVHYTSSVGTIPTCTAAGNGTATYYQLAYPYKISVTGQSAAGQANTIEEQGTITTTVTFSTSAVTNFAAWGMFIDQSPICNGSTLVGGTISGPVFTNGAWNFGTSSYIFTDQVGSASANIGYQFGSCIQSPNTSYTSGSQTIHPTFQSGINLNQPTITPPANSFNQKGAIIDSIGAGNPTNAQMNTLKNYNGTNYVSGTTSSGVYLPYTTSAGPCPCTNTFNGGGIYVEGNAAVTVTASGSTAQVYTIVQGGTTTTVTIDTAANSTVIHSGGSPGTTTNITGVPVNLSSGTSQNATELYVDGNITGLTGGGQGVGDIQDNTALSIVALNNITITGDLLYVHEPVTLTQSGSTPADTLIPANNHGQTLGIFTAGGNINLNNGQSNGNLEIDASIAAIGSTNGGLVNTGSQINTLTIVGGRIQSTLQNINTLTRNVWFDRRYAQGGFAPPWFPSSTVTTVITTPAPTVTATRTSWVNTSAQ